MPLSIAIDGPVGAGKSTIADGVAQALGILHLDSGAMYRAMGLKALRTGTDLQDEAAISALCGKTAIDVGQGAAGQITYLDAEDVSQAIRMPEVSDAASAVSRYTAVRKYLVGLQQDYARRVGMVMDGRDIGTHVLPDAPYKFYLDAAPEERARRRHAELTQKGIDESYESVLAALIARDAQDMGRKVSPLRQAPDARRIDTTCMTQAEVVDAIVAYIKEGEA